jgi:hypothetical protein
MKNLKMLSTLSLLIAASACSLSQLQKPFRSMASSEEDKLSNVFRFYGKHEYLPTKMRIYDRKFYGPVNLHLESDDFNFLSCSGHVGIHSEVTEAFSFSASKVTIPLDKKTSFVECVYSGKNQHADLKVTYEVAEDNEVKISPNTEQLKMDQQLLSNLNEANWAVSLKEIIQKNNFAKTIGASIAANTEFISFPGIEAGDLVEYQQAQGIIQYGISQYDADGTTSISSFDKTKLLFPEAKPYALICGTKNNSTTRIMIEGKKNLSSISHSEDFFCTINTKSKAIIKTSGSFGVKLSHTSKKTVEKYLQDKLTQTQNQIAVWENENRQSEEEKKGFAALLFQSVKILAAKDAGNRYKEPPTYCSKDLVGEEYSYKDIKRLVLGDVGKFCQSPVQLKPNQYLTLCDGDAKTHYSGDFVIFDSTLKVLLKSKLNATEDRITISSVDRPLVRKDSAGKNFDFVLTTKDGRILFYDLNGKLKKTIKVDYEFIENPIMLPDGTMAALAFESLGSNSQRLYYFNDVEIINKIDLPDGNGFLGPYLLNENVFVTGYDGQLLGFSKDKEKFVQTLVEKDGRLSPPAQLNDSTVIVGTATGKLFEVDINTGEKKLLYRAQYTGETAYSFSTSKMEALLPRIEFTPIVLKDGRIAFATSGDGRVHMITPQGQTEWQVSTPIVSGLLNFSALPNTDYFLTGSISYMTIVRPDGHILARYSNSGAENPFVPLPIGKNRFLSGMYNGVFLFELKPIAGTTTTVLKNPCGP